MIMPALVENILRRGFDEVHRAGQVEILSEVRDGKLWIEIRDDLPRSWSGEEGPLDSGLGLANTKARLQHLYGASHNFTLGLKARCGSWLTLEIPLVIRTARPADLPAVQPLFEES
jgi:LytS/YehU family sensor histidine kinase